MIKKSVFEEELIDGMHNQLIKQATQKSYDHLEEAVDYLNSAAEIFEDMGMNKNSDQILMILAKIAQQYQNKQINDRHTKDLTSKKMIQNLKDHGHPMNLVDDHNFLENQEVNDVLEVSDVNIITELDSFEDERD